MIEKNDIEIYVRESFYGTKTLKYNLFRCCFFAVGDFFGQYSHHAVPLFLGCDDRSGDLGS